MWWRQKHVLSFLNISCLFPWCWSLQYYFIIVLVSNIPVKMLFLFNEIIRRRRPAWMEKKKVLSFSSPHFWLHLTTFWGLLSVRSDRLRHWDCVVYFMNIRHARAVEPWSQCLGVWTDVWGGQRVSRWVCGWWLRCD